MPSRSMSPSTVEVTLVSATPRAAAMLTMPAVRQAAMRVQQVLDRGRRVVGADQDLRGGRRRATVSCLVLHLLPGAVEAGDTSTGCGCRCTQVLLARNWNLAISFCPLTASRVANSVGTSTPLSGWRAVAVVISSPVLVGVVAGSSSGWVCARRAGVGAVEPAVGWGCSCAVVRRPAPRPRRTRWPTTVRSAPPPTPLRAGRSGRHGHAGRRACVVAARHRRRSPRPGHRVR